MNYTTKRLEKLISESEIRKKFLEQGVEALNQTLKEAATEIQNLKASTKDLSRPGADPTKTIETIVRI
jgi:uncharacterized coiled-coil protein SlyX